MGILRVDHPDIREFVTCKLDVTQVTNFNISVAITDAFMEAVKAGTPYDLKSPRTGEVIGQEDAREIFDLIVHGAWATGWRQDRATAWLRGHSTARRPAPPAPALARRVSAA